MDPSLQWMFSSMERVVAAAGNGGDPADVGLAFDRFLGQLRSTASLIDRDGMPTGPVDRADGYRNVLMTLHFAMDRLLGEADPQAPAFGQPWPAHLFDWGGAAPDSVYRSAKVAGGVTYRIHGNLGNSPSMSLQFFEAATSASPSGANSCDQTRRARSICWSAARRARACGSACRQA